MLLAENAQGLLVDWELVRDSAPADAQLLPGSVGRLERIYGQVPKAIATDRGFDNEVNRAGLAAEGIYNAVCPRNPKERHQRSRSGNSSDCKSAGRKPKVALAF